MSALKALEHLYTISQPNMVGDGFRVYNAFPSGSRLPLQRLSPFFLLDYGAPFHFPPSEVPRGVDEHPHRGFETVTIAYQGAVSHRDSSGSQGVIREGDVQWMTAASGVVHEEKHEHAFSRQGGILEMIQLWVNLPKAHKMDPPRYQTLLKTDIPLKEFGTGSYLRVIAGTYEDLTGPAQTFSPLVLLDGWLRQGDRLELKLPSGYHTALFLREGAGLNLQHSAEAHGKQLAVFEDSGELIELEATQDSGFLLMSGAPIEEPIVSYGPFVMNTKEEISQAILDYQTGKMGHLD